ncbi:MAG TPA: DUF2782 domain-containing protein [Chiayiivirga sp.]|nr:DUF2782 domain-containing protein [Chiayiivirga sp.]
MRIAHLLLLGSCVLISAPALAQDEPAPREHALPDKLTATDDPSQAPAVTISRRDNGDTVEEYRQDGRLYMVKVTPPNGISYTLMDTNGDGRLDKDDGRGSVAPVYYTIYRWN